jgi:hypothetical protein
VRLRMERHISARVFERPLRHGRCHLGEAREIAARRLRLCCLLLRRRPEMLPASNLWANISPAAAGHAQR